MSTASPEDLSTAKHRLLSDLATSVDFVYESTFSLLAIFYNVTWRLFKVTGVVELSGAATTADSVPAFSWHKDLCHRHEEQQHHAYERKWKVCVLDFAITSDWWCLDELS